MSLAASDRNRRRGACPSLSRPMRTGDGLLVRLQSASGALSPAQLRGLAQAARAYGNGLLEITARGNLQIRGLTEATVETLAVAVGDLGIEARTGVPVETNPLCGLDSEEVANAAPLAEAIRAAAAASDLAARLGPKVTVVVDGGGRFGLGGLLADIRVEAERTAAGVEWLVSIAGTTETATPLLRLPPQEVVATVIRLLHAIDAMGPEARGRDLIGMLRLTPETRSMKSARISERPLVGTHALADGSYALVAAFAFGQAEAIDIEAFADAAERAGAIEIRLASERRLVTLLPSLKACDALRWTVAERGFVTSADDPRFALVACAGAPACASAFLDTKRMAAELTAALHGQGFHVSGCPKRCAEPTGRLPALVGVTPDAAEIVTASGTRRIATGQALAAIRRLHADVSAEDGLPTQTSRHPALMPALP